MAIDFRQNFSWQYQYAKNLLADVSKFDPSWADLIRALQRFMANDGFDYSGADAVNRLRAKINTPDAGSPVADPAQNILKAVGAWIATQGGLIAAEPKLRSSALKFLQHIHLLEYAGGRCVWVHSLPTEFGQWAVLQMREEVQTTNEAATLLRTRNEHFSDLQKQHLTGASMHALAWAHRTNILLACAGNPNSPPGQREAARAMVRRWFADPTTTESDLDTYIAILGTGFKAVTGTLNKGKLVLTDFVSLRRASTDQEIRLFRSEAFVFANRSEGMDIIYIEQAFFNPPARGILNGPKNWIRVLIHELTHLDCATIDVPHGENARYAWDGIAPHAGFPGRDAIRNADSWAFFCADAAGMLTDGERLQALRIT